MEKNPSRHDVSGFVIVWLDRNIDTNRNTGDTKALIRQISRGRLLTFTEPDPCIDYITDNLTEKNVFFIVSNTLGQAVIPIIYEISQIQSVYIFCGCRRTAEQWTKPFTKVAGIHTSKHTLLNQIRVSIGGCDEHAQLPMSIFHLDDRQTSLQNLAKENTTFMWYQSILRVLRATAKYGNSKADMIAECRARYHDDEAEKKKIKNFEEQYTPTKAFWWYTSDSFVYRLLNEALRTQNIEIIFKFRFFINDLHNQIEQLYRQYLATPVSSRKATLTVYRGQRLKLEEVESLKQNVNHLISMNTFLSATSIQTLAKIFADTSDQRDQMSPLQSVLFIIDIHDMNKETAPFAFIEHYSCCPDEEEILFSISAVFKVQSVKEVEQSWHVHLKLSQQHDQDLRHYMMEQVGQDPGPLALGWFLYRMSEFNKAERYIQLLLKEFPSDDRETANAYNLLGLMYKDKQRLDKSIECYKKALDIYSRLSLGDSLQVLAIHYNLALAYLASNHLQSADEQQGKFREKLRTSLHRGKPLVKAMKQTLEGKIQTAQKKYPAALANFQEVFEIKKTELRLMHPSTASTLNDIGVVYEKLHSYDQALKYYTDALDIRQKCLPPNHLDIGECHKNRSRVYEHLQREAFSSKELELAEKIFFSNIRDADDEI